MGTCDHGVVFKRTDINGAPELRPRVDMITDLVRATTIQSGHAKIHTVEHVLSALHGCGIDNVVIEMNASEPPILDGSAKPFVDLIMQGDPVEQEKDREYFTLDTPVSVTRAGRHLMRQQGQISGRELRRRGRAAATGSTGAVGRRW